MSQTIAANIRKRIVTMDPMANHAAASTMSTDLFLRILARLLGLGLLFIMSPSVS